MLGFVTGQRIKEIVAVPTGLVVESQGEVLGDETLRAVVDGADPFVPKTTSTGLLHGVIHRDKVALSVARAVLARVHA